MTRFSVHLGLLAVLFETACAGSSPRSESGGSAETCSSRAPGVDAELVQRLEHASNVLEYENIWRADHPGSTSGTVSGSAVRARIRDNAAQVQSCYDSALRSLPKGGGRVVVRFVIGPDGHVPAVSITSNDFHAPAVGCCVVTRVADWSFPSPTNGGFAVVEYPFVVRISN